MKGTNGETVCDILADIYHTLKNFLRESLMMAVVTATHTLTFLSIDRKMKYTDTG